ncbi:MAG: hypothetical protein ABIY51_01805 [Ferruginibacter sp.]
MKKCLSFLIIVAFFFSCGHKTVPQSSGGTSGASGTTGTITNIKISGTDSTASSTTAVKKTSATSTTLKTATPKSITVNDKAATKTASGRLFYDLEGKRYWRNKKDGKYYLYYKGMFENKNFQ